MKYYISVIPYTESSYQRRPAGFKPDFQDGSHDEYNNGGTNYTMPHARKIAPLFTKMGWVTIYSTDGYPALYIN